MKSFLLWSILACVCAALNTELVQVVEGGVDFPRREHSGTNFPEIQACMNAFEDVLRTLYSSDTNREFKGVIKGLNSALLVLDEELSLFSECLLSLSFIQAVRIKYNHIPYGTPSCQYDTFTKLKEWGDNVQIVSDSFATLSPSDKYYLGPIFDKAVKLYTELGTHLTLRILETQKTKYNFKGHGVGVDMEGDGGEKSFFWIFWELL